ncbi:MAG: hypothetical protein ABIR56_12195 [Polaromonas sp.]
MASPLTALAQAWPSKPIKVIVNFPPGSAADPIACAISLPLLKDRIAGLGGEVALMTPAQFGAKAHEDTARFGKLIKDRHIMGDR